MCHKIDKNFYKELSGMDPSSVCRRALCEFSESEKCYTLTVWGETFAVYPEKEEIKSISKNKIVASADLGLTIIFYLLRVQNKNIVNEWIPEKDIPGGVAFFRGHHAVPSHLIAGKFGNDIKAFMRIAESLGGKALEMADAAYSFNILPRVPVAVLLWKGDEEFPPEAKILFDKTISDHLPIDIVLALTEFICDRMIRLDDALR